MDEGARTRGVQQERYRVVMEQASTTIGSNSPVLCRPCFFKLGRFVSSTPPSRPSLRSSVGLAPRFPLPGERVPTPRLAVSISSSVIWPSSLELGSGALRFRECSLPSVNALGCERARSPRSSASLRFSSSTTISAPSMIARCTNTYCRRLWHRLIRCSRMSSITRRIGSLYDDSNGGDASECSFRGSFNVGYGVSIGRSSTGGSSAWFAVEGAASDEECTSDRHVFSLWLWAASNGRVGAAVATCCSEAEGSEDDVDRCLASEDSSSRGGDGLVIDSFAVFPTIEFVELSAWLVGGLADAASRDRERLRVRDEPEWERTEKESELVSDGCRRGANRCCSTISPFAVDGVVGLIAVHVSLFNVARRTSSTSSGDAWRSAGGCDGRFSDVRDGGDANTFSSSVCPSTSIGTVSVNPATGTCTS
ncbi:hypothetical protein GSI_10006 [Ganoderma sinense ZZ0214-1]|uniref:Uncharacterized protein n=1 Tax=Ganoderma sinense ZZ0214-1 TaxID=1077348 RepID=A0A2G8S2B4_9APHY|nr:hypothetical protein GSI_10006 [Ganoderma sinense ZZ0214-1]